MKLHSVEKEPYRILGKINSNDILREPNSRENF
jgi:hypothetical protein